jgi:serralysin
VSVSHFSMSTVLTLALALALALAVALAAGCSSGPDVLTYEQFQAQAYRETDTGLHVLNGDELVETDEAMAALYEAYLDSVADAADREAGLATSRQALTVNTVSGQDDVWPAGTAQNLTYCVSSSSFGLRYSAVVSALSAAAADWASATSGRVNFVHVMSADADCSTRTNVVFNVRLVNTTQYISRAFFPSTTRKGRELLLSTSVFGNIYPWSLTGVMRHELGHTLGLRHEHTRPEAGTCFEDNEWRALTAYDAASVMHYPLCNGTGTGDLVLTSLDRSGVASLY